MQPKWTKNWIVIETNTSDESTEKGGRSFESFSNGFPFVTKKNSPATTRPTAVSWLSPCLAPTKWRLDKTNAFTKQLTPKK